MGVYLLYTQLGGFNWNVKNVVIAILISLHLEGFVLEVVRILEQIIEGS